MTEKTLHERYGAEVLSDNTGQYAQCKNCIFKDRVNYRKCYCAIYEKPVSKPFGIMKNTSECEYYEEE